MILRSSGVQAKSKRLNFLRDWALTAQNPEGIGAKHSLRVANAYARVNPNTLRLKQSRFDPVEKQKKARAQNRQVTFYVFGICAA